jgi:hypothetical protein
MSNVKKNNDNIVRRSIVSIIAQVEVTKDDLKGVLTGKAAYRQIKYWCAKWSDTSGHVDVF